MLTDVRFSSMKDFFKKNQEQIEYVMKVPYSDTYQVAFKKI